MDFDYYSDHLKEMVHVYWNIQKKLWSIRHKGIVIEHSRAVTLSNCVFVVQQGGRDRVLKEKRKNVHAYVKGIPTYDDIHFEAIDHMIKISYDPYKCNHFYDVKNGNKIVSADYAVFLAYGKVYIPYATEKLKETER